MNPLKHVDWKVVLGTVLGIYAVALIAAVAPSASPDAVAAKVRPASNS